MNEFVPKLFTTLRGYTRQQFTSDVLAGVIVGIVALPLAIAFAIASGVPPVNGLYTAIVAGFLISALGGSRVQIGGPTGAFVIIVAGIVEQYGMGGLTIATFMAGLMLIAMGVARMGAIIKFIPHSLITGFTSGIAVIIALTQLRDFFGLEMASVPSEFVEKLKAYAEHFGTVHPATLGVGLLTLVILVVWPRINRRIPGPLIAIIVTTAVVQLFDLPVDTIGTRFGVLEASLPRPTVPDLSFSEAMRLVSPAFAIALLGAIESLLSAVVADGMIGGHHRSNMELVAQGIANVASPMFGGIPATGAIARTATNVKNGGRTPVAGMVHAVVLLMVTLLFGRWAQLIPMAALAAVLLMVAYHMSEWRTFIDELRAPRADVAVLLLTFALTVVVDLTVAIEVGMVLSAFLFMQRMAEVTNVSAIKRELAPIIRDDLPTLDIPEGVQIFEISGAFFFGAVETFKDTLRQVNKRPKVLIIRMRDVTFLDGTGLRALRDVVRRSRHERTLVLIAEIHTQPLAALERSPLGEELAGEVYMALDDAIDRARTHLADRIPTPLETPVSGPTR